MKSWWLVWFHFIQGLTTVSLMSGMYHQCEQHNSGGEKIKKTKEIFRHAYQIILIYWVWLLCSKIYLFNQSRQSFLLMESRFIVVELALLHQKLLLVHKWSPNWPTFFNWLKMITWVLPFSSRYVISWVISTNYQLISH